MYGQHGYWFAPVIAHPENVEFELVVEIISAEWMYLGRYRSVYLPGGDMSLSEWLVVDDETKGIHCLRAAIQSLGQGTTSPEIVSATASELRKQYDMGLARIPCFTLVCTGFTAELHAALYGAATRGTKRGLDGLDQAGGKRVKKESD